MFAVQAFKLTAQVIDTGGQIRHNAGQAVVPVYEGWFEDSNGDIQVAFGYLNRNYEETIDIPIGSNNKIEPGPPDQGQPTHFPPRREKSVFAVMVPKSTPDTEITWTLTHRGQTYTIPANLDQVFNIDALQQRGGEFDGNKPPVLTFSSNGLLSQGPAGQTLALTSVVSQPLSLAVAITDDGLPSLLEHDVFYSRFEQRSGLAIRPPVIPHGLKVIWSKYRAPGPLVFSESEVTVLDGAAMTTVTFGMPGEYILRAKAAESPSSFGLCCWTNGYVHVTVTP
jgi:hypothetical protein